MQQQAAGLSQARVSVNSQSLPASPTEEARQYGRIGRPQERTVRLILYVQLLEGGSSAGECNQDQLCCDISYFRLN
jgi:hypothetical protein